MPKARDLADLNTQLLAACRADEGRQIAGHQQPVGALMIEERPQLLPLAAQGFELAEIAFPRVDGLGCVRVRTNLSLGAGGVRQADSYRFRRTLEKRKARNPESNTITAPPPLSGGGKMET